MAKSSYIKQVYDYLYPKKNRVIAAVAFVRTFKQTITGVGVVGGGGLITVTATQIAAIDWTTVGYTIIGMILTAFIAGASAFDDVSRNGLNSKYMAAAAAAEAPTVVVDGSAVAEVAKQVAAAPVWKPAPANISLAPAPVAKTAKRGVAKKAAPVELKGGIAKMAPAVELP